MVENASIGCQRHPLRVLSVPHTHPITVRVLGPYVGLLTHFSPGKTVACFGDGTCPPTTHRLRVIWKGYLACDQWLEDQGVYKPGVLEVTEGLEHYLRGRVIRGEVWNLSKPGGRKNSPVVALFSERAPESELRPAFSVEEFLVAFYHSTELTLGVPNPIPPKLMLEALPGKAPKIMEHLQTETPQEAPRDPQLFKRLREQAESFRRAGKGAHNGTTH
jgi:hypothetical protein